ncbi:MAG: hypothetical protein HeimC3_47540 [Candidatus Heimdallarchaeota archaeon LC_3]|nr:MAG: hypothetical protein HeimC3_47540 [Candidatus Heimdallarchaeota archaeon LC_3]
MNNIPKKSQNIRKKLSKARNKASEIRRERLMDNISNISEYIDENPGITLIDLSKKFNFSIGKMQYIVNYCERKNKSIYSEYKVENGRTKRKLFPVSWYERLNWKNMENNETLTVLLKKVKIIQEEASKEGLKINLSVDLQKLLERHFVNNEDIQ